MSSYIAFDLDALNKAPSAARAARVAEDVIIGGLARMWAHCFREKTASLSSIQVAGFFATDADTVPALVAFGFLEQASGTLRVKGADRYLRITEGRSKGGKAAAGNLKKGTKKPDPQPENLPGLVPAAAGEQPGLTPGLVPAFHRRPTTDDRAPTTEVKSTAPAAPRESDALCQDFTDIIGTPYRWQAAKDGVAFAGLRKSESLEEIRRRWRGGLKSNDKWLGVRTVAQLASKWNDLAKLPLDLTGDWRSRVDHTNPDFFAGVEQ